MPTEPDENEILKRLLILEEENARLRRLAESHDAKQLTVTEGEYKGYPTLTFEGPFRSFTLGVRKLSVLKQAWPQVESFLRKHEARRPGQDDTLDDDPKI